MQKGTGGGKERRGGHGPQARRREKGEGSFRKEHDHAGKGANPLKKSEG